MAPLVAACAADLPVASPAPDPVPTPPPALAPPAFCDGATAHRYDPLGDPEVHVFPDDVWRAPGEDGVVAVQLDRIPWADTLPGVVAGIADGLEGLDGYARVGTVLLQFTGDVGEVPSGAEASVTSPAWQWVDLGVTPPTRVPFDATVSADGTQVILEALQPLRAAAPHAVIVTAEHLAADGGCVAPSALTTRLLVGDDVPDELVDHAARVRELPAAIGVPAEAISVAVRFTTHDGFARAATLAQAATAAPGRWVRRVPWSSDGALRRTEAEIEVRDLRGGVDAAVPWTLKVSAWRPADVDGALPWVVYGHGMNGSRGDAGGIARRLADLGVAMVAVDAMAHGDHPTAVGDPRPDGVAFLGLDLLGAGVDAVGLRDNFVQTDLDRLQVLEVIAADPDLDGDGAADVDPTRVGYVGISMGGLLGPGLLALSDRVDAAVLSVGGGRLTRFVTDTALVGPLLPLLDTIFPTPGGVDRMMAVLQAVVDPADPAMFAAHVRTDRAIGAVPPHVLLPVALFDQTVPPATGRALARALRLPHVAPVVEPVSLLPLAPSAPVAGNDLGRTAGFFQYDRVSAGDGVAPADHDRTPLSPEGLLQLRTFLQSWLATGTPEIIDPYAARDTPPLP